MNKVIRENKVAVLYSPGYGSGWYTWATKYPEILYDPKVVDWVENGKLPNQVDALETYLETNYPNLYIGSNLIRLEIEWIPVGTNFRIKEYDGCESIEYRDSINWHTA